MKLASEGAAVTITARNRSEIDQTVKDIQADGGQALGVPGDVTRPEDVARVVDAGAMLRMNDAESLLNQVRITDGFAPWNNVGSSETALDIGALARIVHCGVSNRDMQDQPEAARSFSEVFPARNTCMFEEF
jgi:NAD(P)-dependent dehydrogenase (short-subunit alcohol dehydrogenase family)